MGTTTVGLDRTRTVRSAPVVVFVLAAILVAALTATTGWGFDRGGATSRHGAGSSVSGRLDCRAGQPC